MNFADQPVFVTGATGFIGGRVCERLVQGGARDVRALVHNVQHAARIARLPVHLCVGDLLNADSLPALIGDAKIVIHLGLGHAGAIIKGTRNLLEAARSNGVQRFIHISTAAVYGLAPPPGAEDEDAPMRRTGNVYCDYKVLAEEVVRKFGKQGLPTVILRPSIVCGPYSRWSTRLIENLRQRNVRLIDGGSGICNTTYVDNLVDAIFLAVESEGGLGQSFFITDGEAVTWGDFVRAHASMLDPVPAVPEISSSEVLAHHRAKPGAVKGSIREMRSILVSPEFREMVKRTPIGERLMTWAWYRAQRLDDKGRDRLRARLSGTSSVAPPRKPVAPIPDMDTYQIQTSNLIFSISRAQRALGYTPRISFNEGIRLTREWLTFANCI